MINRIACPACESWVTFSEASRLRKQIACRACGHVISRAPIIVPAADYQPDGVYSRHNHWRTLHRYPFTQPTWSPHAARQFTDQWIADIAKHSPSGCNCAGNWAKANYTIDCSSADAHFRSGWEAHDSVSARLLSEGKQAYRIPYDQAYRLWSGPRVGFLADSYSVIGGTETFHRTLLPRLRERLNIVGFVATRHHTGNPASLRVPYATGIEAAKKLAAECDVLVSWAVPLVKVLGDGPRPRVVAVNHGDPRQEWNYIEENMPWTDAIVGVHAGITERFPTAKHIANCVDPARITPTGKQAELRAKHEIAHDAKIVLYVHRFAIEKQPLKAIEIAGALPPEYVMVMAGNGALDARVKRLATDRVRLLGPIDSQADWLAIADRFISLATVEGYGLSVAEALAAGVPVVSTPTGIAAGRCLQVAHDASIADWVAAIATPQPCTSHPDLCDVDRFVDHWEQVIRSHATY
jgi:glycosyltransferase involved in cell wall biosynthesis